MVTSFNSNHQSTDLEMKRQKLIQLLAVSQGSSGKDIAIIGVSGRYPMAGDLEKYWENLKDGRNCIQEVPADRWNSAEYCDESRQDNEKAYTRWAGFIEDVDKFDPLFFNITPLEAETTDPQERLLLQTVWEVLEDAGYSRNNRFQLSRSVGVFIGAMNMNYELIGGEEWGKSGQVGAHSSFWSLANRISYFFDWQGPSLTVDTACSSSLTAIHLACDSIKKGECETAIAGGVNLILHPAHLIRLCKMEMLSNGECCHSFGSGADGFVDGEGVGAVLLKPLEKAVADGDPIYGVIKGSHINAGGKTSGYTVPNPNAQKELIIKALENAGVNPRTLSYIEAHGTGTALGDPIEISGLSNAFKRYTDAKQYCAIGSSKSNIGHLESAAGIAGLTKILLQLKYRQLVPTLHADQVNPEIDFTQSPFYLQRELTQWRRLSLPENGNEREYPRRAGISSFGAGGANAHLIIEEYPTVERTGASVPDGKNIFLLSAKDRDRLAEYAGRMKDYLDKNPGVLLDEAAYTLQTGRELMEERLAVVVSGRADLLEKLARYCAGETGISGVYLGTITGKGGERLRWETPETERALEEGDLDRLASLWVTGAWVDWSRMYKNGFPPRIHLPFYPFAKERYWVKITAQNQPGTGVAVEKIHPLLDRNVSTFQSLCFQKTFHADDFWVADHRINGETVLPGAVSLATAHAAAQIALKGFPKIGLRNILWGRPIIVKESQEVFITLGRNEAGEIDYQIYTMNEAQQVIVHSQGTVAVSPNSGGIDPIAIEAIKSQVKQIQPGSTYYQMYQQKGMKYGPSFQTIQELYAGNGQVLAYLKLSESYNNDFEKDILHPTLIDGAFQALIGFTDQNEDFETLNLPLALGEIQFYGGFVPEVYAYVVRNHQSMGKVAKFNIQITDIQGNVVADIKDFTVSRTSSGEEKRESAPELNREQEEIQERVEAFLKKSISLEAKIPVEKIKSNEPLENYGINSIMIMRLTNDLENDFQNLSRTLFFENQTVGELASYLIKFHGPEARKKFAITSEQEKTSASSPLQYPKLRGSADLNPGWAEKGFENGLLVKNDGALDIAIIGLNGRYPMSDDLNEFWENLKNGRDCITEIGEERWNYRDYYDPVKGKTGKSYSKWGGFINDFDKFDPLFFNISPAEAEVMDPQERLFLETVWKTIEDGGYSRGELAKQVVGVFVGVMYGQYQLIGAEQSLLGNVVAPSSSFASIANRVSYFFNFQGPSIALDTMCSSALTSIYLACESIQKGVCDLAIAGGVNLTIHPSKYLILSQGKFASTDGRCRSFGAGGDGYVPGEGVGAVLLKPFQKAVADGDYIYAVIKGAAINHGGKTNGYTVPNPKAQTQLLRTTFEKAKIDPATISYIEAHGTGTELGDPIEITGLLNAFSQFTNKRQFCAIGSVKSNIGHLESAAGIAGLTKVLLQMKHRQLVPSLHSRKLNPMIRFDESPFFVQQELTGWDQPESVINGAVQKLPRRAGISAFGAGGANAHIILEEYQEPASEVGEMAPGPYVFVFSALNEERLQAVVKNFLDFLKKNKELPDEEVIDTADLLRRLERDLMALAAEIVQIDGDMFAPEEALSEIGFELMTLAQFYRKINLTLGLACSNEFFGNHISIRGIAGSLLQNCFPSLVEHYQGQLTYCRKKNERPLRYDLESLVYTLQVGREALAERIAVIVSHEQELIDRLTAYVNGAKNIDQFFQGSIRKTGGNAELFSEGQEAREFLKNLSGNKNYVKLARLWVTGIDIDWSLLYQGRRVKRIPLPTYPFSRESYWISKSNHPILSRAGAREVAGAQFSKLHPLIDYNSSTLKEQKFTTRLDAREYYLADHQIENRPVLPGVVYLEMARAAGEFSGETRVRKIKNITWMEPVVADGASPKIDTVIRVQGDRVRFEILSLRGERKVTHCQGELVFAGNIENQTAHSIQLEELEKTLGQPQYGAECYERFQLGGIYYGESFRVIEELRHNQTTVLAKLRLPERYTESLDQYGLHPLIMDGCLQSVIGLITETNSLYLPFAVEEIEILGPLKPACHVIGVLQETGPSSRIKKFNLQIVDENGQVLIQIKDFSLNQVKTSQAVLESRLLGVKAATSATEFNRNILYLRPRWEKASAVVPQGNLPTQLLIFDTQDQLARSLKQLLPTEAGIILVTPGESFAKISRNHYEIHPGRYQDYVKLAAEIKNAGSLPDHYVHRWAAANRENQPLRLELTGLSVFFITKILLQEKSIKSIKFLYLYPGEVNGSYPQNAGVTGLVKTINQESSTLFYKTIELEGVDDQLAQLVLNEFALAGKHETTVKYVNDQRMTLKFERLNPAGESGKIPLRERGVYLITGGAGAIGFAFAEYLAKKVKANLILTGRSALSQGIESKISSIKSLGADIEYVKADVSDPSEVNRLIEYTRKKFQKINGIIQSAGVLRDAMLMNKDETDFQDVIKPKVYGTLYLDEATCEEKLDFFILFSSIAGMLGSMGQCDYSFGNAYLDHFAAYRESLRKQQKRSGRTISINWPLWQDGGMTVDAAMEAWMRRNMGMTPLVTGDGLRAFEDCFRFASDNTIVLAGDQEKLGGVFGLGAEQPLQEVSPVHSRDGRELAAGLRDKTIQFLKELVAGEIKIEPGKVGLDDPFENFGMNSILMMNLLNKLENPFPGLPKTLFFEYQTLRDLTDYFLSNQNHRLLQIFGAEPVEFKIPERQKIDDNLKLGIGQASRFIAASIFDSYRPLSYHDEIAIIGLQGRYPRAKNLEEYWRNLGAGEDCITEILEERWDYQNYYHPERGKGGTIYSKWGGFIADADKFDPLFFNISPLEAEMLDPQERLFLETAWHTIEDAGYTRTDLRQQKIGVFVGVMSSHYQLFGAEETLKGNFMAPSSTYASIANRVSYFFDLRGPSMALDTMCSSSLTALHLACQSICCGESSMALAGGVNLSIHPMKYLQLCQGEFASSDGRCRSFGEGGDGYVPGEGVGAALLKPLHQAIADGDHIYGIIKGSAINHGGKTNGYTVPNPNAQRDLILESLENAGVNPKTINYIEAHGTGTSLGDPIEITGLMKAYEKYTSAKQFCAIGSVKSNIGHLEAAAGIAAISKVLLQLQNKQLAPSIHAETLNPNIDFLESPFYVQKELTPWNQVTIDDNGVSHTNPRRAGISAFGAGGSNAHFIIEEYVPGQEGAETETGPIYTQLFIFSAKKLERLIEYVKSMKTYLNEKQVPLNHFAYTLQVGREGMEVRLAIIAGSKEELIAKLESFLADPEKGGSSNGIFFNNLTRNSPVKEFIDGVFGPELVQLIREHYDLKKLAILWTGGARVPWQELYQGHRLQRISIPKYPFERKRYWLPLSQNTEVALFQAPGPAIGGVLSKPAMHSGVVMLTPVWNSLPINKGEAFPSSGVRVLVIGGTKANLTAIRKYYPNLESLKINSENSIDEITQELNKHETIAHLLFITPDNSLETLADEAVIEGQNRGIIQVFRTIKALLHMGYGTKDLGLTLLTFQAQPIRKLERVNPTHAGLHGLVGSLAKEYPNWKIRLIDLEAGCEWPLADIFTLPPDPQGEPWAYRNGEWYRSQLLPFQCPPLERKLYRKGGVYVVIGGAGGIGTVWSECMIRTYQAQIVWIGRRPLDTTIQAKLDKLAAYGPAPLYLAADATDGQALNQAYHEIKARYSKVHGVVHAAIRLLDQSLANMEEENFRAALAAKVEVSVRLMQVFKNESLELALFFSSFQSFLKAPGQSNYAAGCTFKDAFAHQMALELPSCAVKIMNWGYWGSVGVVASKEYQERMAEAGIGSIEAPEAMEALDLLLAGPTEQMALIKITKPSVLESFQAEESIGFYAKALPSVIQKFPGLVPKQVVELQNRKPEERLQQEEMDRLLGRLLWVQLQSVGIFTDKKTSGSALKTRLSGIYQRWLEASIGILVQNHYLEKEGESYIVGDTAPVDASEVWEEWAQQMNSGMADPNRKAQVKLLDVTLRALPDILTGKQRATDVMFPNSSMELVEGIYKNNAVADFFNEMLADTVISYVQERFRLDPAARIRLIEVGAGTGGTSVMVFRKLAPYREHIQEYCYTDLSKAFLFHAEKSYGPENPYLTYRIFDAAKPVAEQGLRGEYDLAIAANVLHATKNIRQTLRNVKAVLRRNGLLLLNEISDHNLFTHLTFGLLDGWWLYEDPAIRIPGCPGIYPATWQMILESEGFQSVWFPAQTTHELGQQIIVAESDGAVRQKQPVQQGITSAELVSGKSGSKPPETSRGGVFDLHHAKADKIQHQLKQIISGLIKMPEDELDLNEDIRNYGFDSIVGLKLINRIEQQFGKKITPAVLFELNTIKNLVDYLAPQTAAETGTSPAVDDHEPVETQLKYYPLSEGQKALWLIHQMAPENTAYNLPFVFSVQGKVRLDLLEETFKLLIKRHPILHSTYHVRDGQPVQLFKPAEKIHIQTQDVSTLTRSEKEKLVREIGYRPFDLEKGPLMRLNLLSESESASLLLITFHHLIFDLTSVVVLIRDINEIYHSLALNKPVNLSPLQNSYLDFVNHEIKVLNNEEGVKQKEYWLRKLAGELPILNLPLDFPRPKLQSYHGKIYRISLPDHLTEKVKKMSRKEKKSLFTILISAYTVLLSKYSNQDDILIGTPFSGRNSKDFEDLIGYFINMVVLRSQLSEGQTFKTLMENVQQDLYASIENCNYPFRRIVGDLGLGQDRSGNPIYNVAFAFQNSLRADYLEPTNREEPDEKTVTISLNSDLVTNQEGELDLYLEIIEVNERYMLLFKYNPDLFQEDTIRRMADSYLEVVHSITENPNRRLAAISILSQADKEILIHQWNETARDYSMDKTIHQLFEEQVQKNPEKTALICNDQTMTYRELNEKANRIARFLRNQGVKRETPVGIMTYRSLEMMVGIMGILKAGGAYVPIDPEYPEYRRKYILENADISFLLINRDLNAGLDLKPGVTIVALDSEASYLTTGLDDDQAAGANLENVNSSRDLAYIIFTSGSTGNPKGVMIEHRSVHNLVIGLTDQIDFSPEKPVLALASFSFDMSKPEIILPLLTGQTIVIANEAEQKDLDLLTKLIITHNVKMMQATPSRMGSIIRQEKWREMFQVLTDIMIGAEGFPQKLFDDLTGLTKCNLYNMYGPTETTVWSTFKHLAPNERVTVGKPIANTDIYIIDKNNQPVPIGVAGELCIGGHGLARGYFKNPDLTREKFVVKGFGKDEQGLMYKTGDLARWLPNGNIEILGRVDRQVKIRGYRIELGEIEFQLEHYPQIKEAVVVAKEDPRGNKSLCAYFVAEKQMEVNVLREYLAGKLPDYMVPSYFIQMEKLPLTPNGKIDVNSLPAAELTLASEKTALPATKTEAKVLQIWQEVLGVENISTVRSFFEIGGESLLATQIIVKIREEFQIDIPFRLFFENYTIQSLSAQIERQYLGGAGEEPGMTNREVGAIDAFSSGEEEREEGII